MYYPNMGYPLSLPLSNVYSTQGLLYRWTEHSIVAIKLSIKPKYDEKILFHFLDKSSSLKLSGLVSSTFSGQISMDWPVFCPSIEESLHYSISWERELPKHTINHTTVLSHIRFLYLLLMLTPLSFLCMYLCTEKRHNNV